MYTEKLPLAGLPNTRDLGGMPAKNGTIRPHRLIRSGLLGHAAPESLAWLTDVCGMHTVVDFRTKAELADKPDPVLPGVRAVHVPILRSLTNGISRENEGQTPIAQLTQEIHDMGLTAEQFMANLYISMVCDAHAQQHYARFFDILLDSPSGATLWHCSVGKDRVGMGTAMLQMALGVAMDDVMDDYLATQKNVQAFIDRDCAIVEQQTGDPRAAETVRALNGVMPSYLTSSFAQMEKLCGSVDAYLAQKIGLTPEKCARLQEMYIG